MCRCPQKPGEGVGSPGTEVVMGTPMWMLGTMLGYSEEL